MQTWILLTKVDMTGLFNRSNINEGNLQLHYIIIFQNAHAISISVGNSYSEDQLMHTFMDNFHQGEKILIIDYPKIGGVILKIM